MNSHLRQKRKTISPSSIISNHCRNQMGRNCVNSKTAISKSYTTDIEICRSQSPNSLSKSKPKVRLLADPKNGTKFPLCVESDVSTAIGGTDDNDNENDINSNLEWNVIVPLIEIADDPINDANRDDTIISDNVDKEGTATHQKQGQKRSRSRAERRLQPPCNCRKKCSSKITESTRSQIFNVFNSLPVAQQNEYIVSNVEEYTKKSERLRQGKKSQETPARTAKSRRKMTKKYKLAYSINRIIIEVNVCHIMFINTLDITNKKVRVAIANAKKS